MTTNIADAYQTGCHAITSRADGAVPGGHICLYFPLQPACSKTDIFLVTEMTALVSEPMSQQEAGSSFRPQSS